ncbi:hypothetical protein [Streptomyces violaceusniger]|uniref:hypothetical protein n=1 Tax=Streptomyces violaceusniger TaxID=68280 RepID=UPI0037FE977B
MTAQQTTPASEKTTTEYHWIMTVQTPDGRMTTRDAVITVPDGSNGFTRASAFDYVLKQFEADHGSRLAVLFFDLQPNQF